jgi:ABC-type nitrate/sulfonate/bicarbonate transport system permease component
MRRLAAQLLVTAVALAAWQLATKAAASPYFPPPTAIVPVMYRQWFDGPAGRLWLTSDAVANLLPSLSRMLTGWVAASVAGVAAGVALGRLPRLAEYVEPLVHFGRAVPPPTLVPVFLFVLRIGTPMEVATITFGVIWPVLLNSIDGARQVQPMYIETARAFRMPAGQRLVRIILPSAAPKILAGLRLGLALALVMMIVSEFVASTNGIGAEMGAAQSDFNVPLMWAIIVLLGLLGIAMNGLFTLAERRILSWQPAARTAPLPETNWRQHA